MIDIEKLKQQIGDKLKAAREERGMSQEEVAKMLGLSKVGYGALERGKNLIGLQYLIMLTFILSKPITSFLPDYIVTDPERNNALLDPRLRDIVDRWDELDGDFQDALHDLVAVYLTKGQSKQMPPLRNK